MPNTIKVNSKINKEQQSIGLGKTKNRLATLMSIQESIAVETDHHKMSLCAKSSIKLNTMRPTIEGHNGIVKITGTVLCHSRLCPLCSNIKSKKEEEQLEVIMTYLVPKGWSLYFITKTKSTGLSFKNSYLANKDGLKKINAYAKNQKRDYGVETIRYNILEETYSNEPTKVGRGSNSRYITTAHSHVHSLYGFPPETSKSYRIKYIKGVVRTWKLTMQAHGFRVGSKGVDVKIVDDSFLNHKSVSKYISGIISDKTNLHKELSQSHKKVSKGRSLTQLMIDISKYNLSHDLKAYKDTINTYYRKQRVFKSRNWKKVLELAKEYHRDRIEFLAQDYVNRLRMDYDFIEEVKSISNTEYSFLDNLSSYKDKKSGITYRLELPHEMWDYITRSKSMIARLIRVVSIISSGGKKPPSIRLLEEFIDERPDYSNSLMRRDEDLNFIIEKIKEDVSY